MNQEDVHFIVLAEDSHGGNKAIYLDPVEGEVDPGYSSCKLVAPAGLDIHQKGVKEILWAAFELVYPTSAASGERRVKPGQVVIFPKHTEVIILQEGEVIPEDAPESIVAPPGINWDDPALRAFLLEIAAVA